MKAFATFVFVSIGLVIVYVLVSKSAVYQKVFAKVTEWIATGVTAITTGGVKP